MPELSGTARAAGPTPRRRPRCSSESAPADGRGCGATAQDVGEPVVLRADAGIVSVSSVHPPASSGEGVAAIMLAGGGYSTHAVIPAETAIKLPSGFDYDIAAALMVQGLTAYLV